MASRQSAGCTFLSKCLRRGIGWLLVGVVLHTPAAADELILRIVASDDGCMTVLTNRAGGVYQACEPDWRFRSDERAPKDLPVDLAACQDGLLLSSREGMYVRPTGASAWYRLTDTPTGPIACIDTFSVARPFGEYPKQLLDGQLRDMSSRGLPVQELQQLLLAEDDTLYAAGFGAGVFRLASGASTWETLNEGLVNRQVLALTQTADSSILIGTFGGGLYRLAPDARHWQPVPALDIPVVSALLASPTSGLWLAAGRDGAWQSVDAGQTWQSVTALEGAVVLAFAEDHQGSIWAGTADGRLFVQRGQSWERVRFGRQFNVHQLTADVHGNLWVLMDGNIHYRPPDAAGWRTIAAPLPEDAGQARLVADGNGGLYLGSPRQPLRHFPSGQAAAQSPGPGLPEEGGVRDLLRATDGRLYTVLASSGRVYRRHPDDGRWSEIHVDGAERGYSVNHMARLPGDVLVAWSAREILWRRPEDPWRYRWIVQLGFEMPGLDRARWLWTQRSQTLLGVAPGQAQFTEGMPAGPVYRHSIRFSGDAEFALDEEGEVVWLGMGEDGQWYEVHRYPAPAAGPYRLAAGQGLVYLGTAEGLFELDPETAAWREVTPGH